MIWRARSKSEAELAELRLSNNELRENENKTKTQIFMQDRELKESRYEISCHFYTMYDFLIFRNIGVDITY